MNLNIPNLLTTLRLILVPIFIYSMLGLHSTRLALVFFALAGFVDIVDGFIARKFNQITDFGKLYDPFVDKLMQISALLCLYITGKLPGWVMIILSTKEIAMIIAALILYKKNIITEALWYGKLATVIFYIAVLLIIMLQGVIGQFFLYLKIVLISSAFLSFVAYFVEAIKIMSKRSNNKLDLWH